MMTQTMIKERTRATAGTGRATWQGRATCRALLTSILAISALAPVLRAEPVPATFEPPAPVTPQRFTLERCITTATAESRLIRTAELDLDVAEKQVSEAWANVYPTIDGTANYTRNLTDNEIFLPARIFDPTAPQDQLIPVNFSADNNWLASVNLDQPLFQAEVFIGVGAASRFRALRAEELRGERQVVATRVRRLFFDALLAQEQERLTEESIRRVSSTLEEARAMNRAGLQSDYDVLRIDVQLGNLRPFLRRAQNAAAAAHRALNVTMGIEVETSIVLEGNLRDMQIEDVAANNEANAAILRLSGLIYEPLPEVESVWPLAQEYRSDIRQARLLERLSRTQLSAEKATYYPRLFAFGSYTLSAQENDQPNFFGETENDRTSNWAAGLRLELPIFEGLGRPARVARRRLEVEQSQTRTLETEEQALGQLRTILDTLHETRQRAAAQRHAVGQAERGFEIASLEYREGIGSQLQVTDAEEALRQSEFNYAQAVYDHFVARADLDQAAGIVPGVDASRHANATEEQ